MKKKPIHKISFKRLSLVAALLLFSFTASALSYYMAFGARFGKLNNGVTFKKPFGYSEDNGFEVQLYSSLIAAQYGYSAKGFVYHQATFRIPLVELPLDFIIGGGVQAGYFPYDEPGYYKVVDGKPAYYNESVVTAGVMANIGIEYQFTSRKFPFAIGLDAVPSFDFLHRGPDWFDFGVDIRYMIR